jgi:hypothetical protein
MERLRADTTSDPSRAAPLAKADEPTADETLIDPEADT